MSTITDLGLLSSFQFKTGSMIPNGKTQTDIYKFTIDPVLARVSIGTFPSSPSKSPFALSLFKDTNNSGALDNGDTLLPPVSDSGHGDQEASEFMSQKLTGGTYFARAKSFTFDNVNYGISFIRSISGGANPLAVPEIPLGTLGEDLTRRGQISDRNTADQFAFSLGATDNLSIGVKELGNQKGNVKIRVVQDLNGNGKVDENEVVVLGTSSSQGNIDTITGLKGAGDYILQVCQTQGKTKFAVDFDHSAA